MGRWVVAVVSGAALLGAPPAGAQSPSYGGGLLPAAAPPRSYTPTMGVVLQPRGGGMAFRFDTTLRCGSTVYDAAGRGVAPFDGRSFSAKAARQFSIGTNGRNRVVFRWTLTGAVDGTIGSGRLYITGFRMVGGRRSSCRHKPRRRFAVRVEAPAPTGAPTPPARAAFGGLSAIEMADGLRGAVVLKVSRNATKIASRWTAAASCGKGHRAQLVNFTPPMRIRPDGSFSRSERFGVSYADAFVRYRVRFAGRISGETASGTLRLRARRYSADGKRLRTRCDSGTRSWSARLLRPIAPAPATTSAEAAPTPIRRRATS